MDKTTNALDHFERWFYGGAPPSGDEAAATSTSGLDGNALTTPARAPAAATAVNHRCAATLPPRP